MRFKIKYHDDFKADYKKVISFVKDPHRLNRELYRITQALILHQSPPADCITNPVLCRGADYHECFIYDDGKYLIVMYYKIKGHRIYLARIGTPKTFTSPYYH